MNYQQKYEKDLKFGLTNEKKKLDFLNEYFDTDLDMTTRYNLFDFVNSKYLIELKTRRTASKTYPTLMMGQNKINYGKEVMDKKDVWFIFEFTDGVYGIRLNKEVLEKSNQNQFIVCRRDRFREEKKLMCFLDTEDLVKLK